jgi:SAM-dependent methyltransferase
MCTLTVSIFTPTHKNTYLLEAYYSIKDQPYDQWVIYPNGGLTELDIPDEIKSDSRTKLVGLDGCFQPILASDGLANIGSLKKYACSQCTGEILVEFDHDDMLISPGIERIREVFRDPEIVFAYSNTAEFNQSDKSPRFFGNANAQNNYDSHNGWRYRDFYYDNVLYKEALSPSPNPYNVSIILFAPNHLRSFRKSTYDEIGGHNENMHICDDQDLMCRMYLKGKFYWIDECCYLYRVTGQNSWLQRNSDIQETMVEVQKQYIQQMVEVWAQRNNSDMIDLGGRFGCPPGYKSVDLKDADIICDLNEKWPFDDSSIGVIRAYDTVEHLNDMVHVMSEMYRVLRPGGFAFLMIPSTDGRGAWQDPTHKLFINQNSFFYYTRQIQAKYIDNTTIRFRAVTLETYFPSDWERNNDISYVRADLMVLKGDYPVMGHNDI